MALLIPVLQLDDIALGLARVGDLQFANTGHCGDDHLTELMTTVGQHGVEHSGHVVHLEREVAVPDTVGHRIWPLDALP